MPLPDDSPTPQGGSITPLYQAVVGPRNQAYYLQRFGRFDDLGRTLPSWHWPASLMSLSWLLYRGLWGHALAYAALALGGILALFGFGKPALGLTDAMLHMLLGLVLAASFMLPGLWGNAWYYRRCKRHIAAAVLATPDNQQAARQLTKHAPTHTRAWVLLALNVLVLLPALAGGVMLLHRQQSGQPLPWLGAAAPQAVTSAAMPANAAASAQPSASAASRAVSGNVAHEQGTAASAPVAAEPAMTASKPAQQASVAAQPVSAAAGAAVAAAPASAAASAHAAAAVPVAAATPAKPPPSTPKAGPAAAPRADPQPAVTASAAASKPARGYFVDAGIYAEAANAQRAVEKLRGAQLPVVTEQLQMVRGERTRVRVGPFADAAQARKAAVRVKALGLPAQAEPRAEPVERPLFQ